MGDNLKFFLSYFKQRRIEIITFLVFVLVFLCVFALYKITLKAVIYPALICAFLGAVLFYFDYKKAYDRHKRLVKIQQMTENITENLPEIITQSDEDYQNIITLLESETKRKSTDYDMKRSDMIDYYTAWVHQIKTPIASARLTLQNETGETARILSEELFRIEQYVEMVLVFLRLDSDYTDYVIKESALDDIVKASVKRFSSQFIRKRISLDYQPLNVFVLTDEKWLSFVIEQVLSNALKYTNSGTISIYTENGRVLCIRDTGIGIAPEDLPRIFEKGFTGYNGRADKKATGIGLYLCKRVCQNLGHTIKAESSPEAGTVIKIDLNHIALGVE